MRLLWLSHFVPYPPAGGALQRSYHLLRHAAQRHDVELVALNQPRLLPTRSQIDGAVEALSEFCESVRVLELPAEQSRAHRVANLVQAVVGNAPFDEAWLQSDDMRRVVSAQRPVPLDLVHADTVGLWPYVERMGATPVVLGHHNVESDLVERRATHEAVAWRSYLMRRDAAKLRALEARAARQAAVNIAVSTLDAERLGQIAHGAAVDVVDNGVDAAYWAPSSEPVERGTLMFAGTLGWYPNRDAVEFLLGEVWPRLAATQADRRLLFVGRDPPEAARRAAAADTRVVATGFVADVRPYFRRASIFLCPIRVGGGTRLKVLDALAMAKPVISTAIGVEGLELNEGEHYLRAETGAEFVAQIERLEREPALAAALGAAGRARVVERYDWSVIGRRLDAAYARATESAPALRSSAS